MRTYAELEVEATGRLTEYRRATLTTPEEPSELDDVEVWVILSETAYPKRVQMFNDHPMYAGIVEDLHQHLIEKAEDEMYDRAEYERDRQKDRAQGL